MSSKICLPNKEKIKWEIENLSKRISGKGRGRKNTEKEKGAEVGTGGMNMQRQKLRIQKEMSDINPNTFLQLLWKHKAKDYQISWF